MKKRTFLGGGLILILLLIVFLQNIKNSYANRRMNNDRAKIILDNSSFSNARVKVSAGTTVTWVNHENIIHTVTADNGSFNSGDMRINDTYIRTFNIPGIYPYHCAYHTAVKDTIIVIAD